METYITVKEFSADLSNFIVIQHTGYNKQKIYMHTRE